MTANRLWIVVIALASVVVVALGWTLGVKPQLDAAISSDQQREAVVLQNAQHAADLAELEAQYADIASLRRELAGLRAAIPAYYEDDAVVGTVKAIAAEMGVAVVSIAWGEAKFYTQAVSAGGAAPVAPPATDSTSETTDETTDDTASTAVAPPVVAVSDPSAGVVAVDAADVQALTTGQLVAKQLTVTITADYGQVLRFMTRLAESPRLFLVTGASLAPGTGAGPGASTITGLVYALPGMTGAPMDSSSSGEPEPAASSD